jgi:3'-5' exoribonuclease
LIAAALLHDVGKTREFVLGAEIALSDEGRLVGHVVLGQQMVAERSARLADFPQDKAIAVSHCILTHHGAEGVPARRFGSAEALALYRLNALDAGVKGALEHGLTT